MRILYLSTNGFGKDSCVAFGSALPQNTNLQELNLSKNRIVEKSLNALMLGVLKNEAITTLNLSGNPITPAAVLNFVRALFKIPTSYAVRNVDLCDITIDHEFHELAERLRNENMNDCAIFMVVHIAQHSISTSIAPQLWHGSVRRNRR